MKIRAIALNTFFTLVRDKLIILFCAGFLCLVLLMMSPMLMAKSKAGAMTPSQVEGMVVGMISLIIGIASGFGSLLAAWSAADAVGSEMKSGTILAVLARPVRRWEFLLGKYLGVQLLMSVYVVFLVFTTYLLGWIAGESMHPVVWALVVYPMVRYAIYSAIAMALVTAMHPVLAFGAVLVVSVLTSVAAPSPTPNFLTEWLRTGLYAVLPSTGLFSETKFLAITSASLRPTPWSTHVTALVYGLDYALVCFLLAVWSFRRRGLTRE
jgi:ABC-type transport system involved in multi-copper enzyme maturation permease subunit